MRRGDLVEAELVLSRACRHSVSVECGCEPREQTVHVAGEVFCPNNDELDAEVYAAAVNGAATTLTPSEETKAEDALIDAWRVQFERKTG